MALPAATMRVWHGGNNTGTDPNDWADAYTSLSNTAVKTAAAGSVIWVASDHSETGAVDARNSTGSPQSLVTYISVDRTDDSYLPATSPQIDGSSNVEIGTTVKYRGLYLDSSSNILFRSGDSLNLLEDCTIVANLFYFAYTAAEYRIRCKNCTFTFGQIIPGYRGDALFEDCVFTGSDATGQITVGATNTGSRWTFVGCDLSSQAKVLDDMSGENFHWRFSHCKLAASWQAIGTGTIGIHSSMLFEYCDDGTIAAPCPPLNYYVDYYGDITHEETTVRTGGATDKTTPFSWKFVSGSYCDEIEDITLSCPVDLVTWAEPGSYNLRIYFAGATQLQDDEIYIEVFYPHVTGTPTAQHSFISSRVAIDGTPANLTTDSDSVWGGSPTYKQYMEVNIAPAIAGLVRVKVHLAKPLTTAYVDPFVHIITAVA